jgi:hypothetical protein
VLRYNVEQLNVERLNIKQLEIEFYNVEWLEIDRPNVEILQHRTHKGRTHWMSNYFERRTISNVEFGEFRPDLFTSGLFLRLKSGLPVGMYVWMYVNRRPDSGNFFKFHCIFWRFSTDFDVQKIRRLEESMLEISMFSLSMFNGLDVQSFEVGSILYNRCSVVRRLVDWSPVVEPKNNRSYLSS